MQIPIPVRTAAMTAFICAIPSSLIYSITTPEMRGNVAINGEYQHHWTFPDAVDIPLGGPLEGTSIEVEGERLLEIYQRAKEQRKRHHNNFVDFAQIAPIADDLYRMSGEDTLKYIQNVLAFTNATISYCRDNAAYYYPKQDPEKEMDYGKFPLQALNDGCGDCDDYTILVASFLAYKNIETGMALTYTWGGPHAAVGIALDETEGLDRIVFSAARQALGDVKSTLGWRGSHPSLQVRKRTRIDQLARIIEKDVPVIIGRRFSQQIEVTDHRYKPRKSKGNCNEWFWAGGMGMSVVDTDKRADFSATKHQTIGYLLAHANRLFRAGRENSVRYQIPGQGMPKLVINRSMDLNQDDDCQEVSGRGVKAMGWAPIAPDSLKAVRKKPKKMFYLEPQREGWTLHRHIPNAVKWYPLKKNKYPPRSKR